MSVRCSGRCRRDSGRIGITLSASCGRSFEIGTEYIVFTSTSETHGAPWSVNSCSATTQSTNERTRDAAIAVYGMPRTPDAAIAVEGMPRTPDAAIAVEGMPRTPDAAIAVEGMPRTPDPQVSVGIDDAGTSLWWVITVIGGAIVLVIVLIRWRMRFPKH